MTASAADWHGLGLRRQPMLHASAMGTWGPGPFYNDAAAAFLDALRASPTRLIAKTLREIACTAAGNTLTSTMAPRIGHFREYPA